MTYVCSWLVGHQSSGRATTAAATAAAADSVVSTQDALKQHKEWLVNFRRDMNVTPSSANVTDRRSLTAERSVPTKLSELGY